MAIFYLFIYLTYLCPTLQQESVGFKLGRISVEKHGGSLKEGT